MNGTTVRFHEQEIKKEQLGNVTDEQDHLAGGISGVPYVSFPLKLHDMLDAARDEGFESIVSWLPNVVNGFKVHIPHAFVTHIMPCFFRQTKYKSFQRQLNRWSFNGANCGPGNCGYMHTWFVRDDPSLCSHMKRLKINGKGVPRRTALNDDSTESSPCPTRGSCSPNDVSANKERSSEPKQVEGFSLDEFLSSLPKESLPLLDSILSGEQLVSAEDLKYIQIGYQLGAST
jgi:hypothetical protein